MPPVWRSGSWLLYTLIQVNYLIAFAFNLALAQPIVRGDDLIRIACAAGEMTFRRVDETATLTMQLLGGAFTYYLTVVLRTTPLDDQERPNPSQAEVSVPHILSHPSPDTRTVPPGVPFELPCPSCQRPLERGEYCQAHRAEGLTILRRDPEDSLEDHLRAPFLILPSISHPFPNRSNSQPDESQRSSVASPPPDSSSLPSLASTSTQHSTPSRQHADLVDASLRSRPHIPEGQLRLREGMGRAAYGIASTRGRRASGTSSRGRGNDIRPVPNTPGDHPAREGEGVSSLRNHGRRRQTRRPGGATLPVPPPTPTGSL
jgi:hypothetical protein